MGGILPAPIRSTLLSREGDARFRVGAAQMQGFREAMEDDHCICLGLGGHPETAFFGVYDGHAGDRVSKHLALHLHHRIADLGPAFADRDIQTALVDFDLEVGRTEMRHNGSTCVFTLVRPLDDSADARDAAEPRKRAWRVTAVNIGDSRAILVRSNGALVSLTHDHKPSDRQEGLRIRQAGGFVQNDRTDGDLAMSRAVGDFKYKMNTSLGPTAQKVIAVPDIAHDVAYSGDRLLIFCDGVVERIGNKEVARFIHTNHDKFRSDPALLMRELLFFSLASGSTDNHSAILVSFEDGAGYHAKDEFLAGPLSAFRDDSRFVNAYLKNARDWGQTNETLPAHIKQAEASMSNDWKRGTLSASKGSFSTATFFCSLALLAAFCYCIFVLEWSTSRDSYDDELF